MKSIHKKIRNTISSEIIMQLIGLKQEIKEKIFWNIADKVLQKLENEYEIHTNLV